MFRKTLIAVLAVSLVSQAAAVPSSGHVYTDTEVYHTIISESPYLVDITTTVVWTQGPTITASADVPALTGDA